jgi:hypothetical protein
MRRSTVFSHPLQLVFRVLLILNVTNRLIQEEKQSTEQRAEELESRVGSIEHMNLLLQSQSTASASYGVVPNSHPVQRLTVPPQPPPR